MDGTDADILAVGSKSGFNQFAIGHSSVCNSSCELRGSAEPSGFLCKFCRSLSVPIKAHDYYQTYEWVRVPEELAKWPPPTWGTFGDINARLHLVLRIFH